MKNQKAFEWVNVPLQPGKNSTPNLKVLKFKGAEVGYIWKPKDTKTDKNAWKVCKGIGEKSVLIANDSFCMTHAKNQLQIQFVPYIKN